MDANGIVHAVTGRNTNNGKVIYEAASTVELPEGPKQIQLATFDSNLAGTAKGFEGGATRVSFRFDVKQNGQYTNYYLKAIAPEGQLPVEADIPIVDSNQGRRGGGNGRGSYGKTMEERKSIVKQNVLRTATDFVGQFYQGMGPDFYEEAKKKALDFALELFEIAKEQAPAAQEVEVSVVPAAQPQTQSVPPTTPAEVAAEVPGVQVGVQTTEQQPAASDVAWN